MCIRDRSRTMFYSVQQTVTKMISTDCSDDRQLCCLLFYCFKMNWGDSSREKWIQKFCFQFHLVRKTCTRKLVPVFWYGFSVPVSGVCVCVIGIRCRLWSRHITYVTTYRTYMNQYLETCWPAVVCLSLQLDADTALANEHVRLLGVTISSDLRAGCTNVT